MDAGTLRFLLTVLAVGVVVIVGGLAWTRMREEQADAALTAPPERPVPGLPADGPAPTYVRADHALTPRDDVAAALALDDAARTELQTLLDDTEPTLAVGWADERLATDPASGLAVLEDARVLVLAEGLVTAREHLALVAKAGPHPLVVVTPAIDPALLDTVVANLAQGLRRDAVVVTSAEVATALAERLGTRAIGRADLQSGWLPVPVPAARWVSSRDASWLLSEPSA